MLRKIAVLFMILCLAACAAGNADVSSNNANALIDGKPHWFWKPSVDGKLGGVGEAGFNVNGPSAQRQLAIMRAIEDIALQKGVTVQNVQSITQNANSSGTSSTSVESYSVHTVDGRVVSAEVREIWKDPITGRLLVWAVEIQ